MIGYVLMGFAVYALFAYLFEEFLVTFSRITVVLLRVAASFAAAFFVGGLWGLFYGLAVLGVSRMAARIDNYLTTVIVSLQRRT